MWLTIALFCKTGSTQMISTIKSIILYIIIFVTGMTGLIYQVTWQKYISRLLGSDCVSTAIILSVFLGGLSFGYFMFGKLSQRVKNHLKAYAVLEGIIGAWCLNFPVIYDRIVFITSSWSFSVPFWLIIQGFFCAILLIGIPTFCMGGTIPILTQAITQQITHATATHAKIYAINAIGACTGSLIAGFFLIPIFGIPLTVMGTAFINLGTCLTIYLIMNDNDYVKSDHSITVNEKHNNEMQYPLTILCMIAFLNGFFVMTLENAIIRLCNLSFGSSSYTFSIVVSVFIFSIAVGSYIVTHLRKISGSLLFMNQLTITLSLLLIYLSLDTWPYCAHLIRISFQSHIVGMIAYYINIFMILTLVLFIPVSCMGMTIPIAFSAIANNIQKLGFSSGLLFSVNTIGNLTGSLIGGIVFYYYMNLSGVYLSAVIMASITTCLAAYNLNIKKIITASVLTLLIVLSTIINPFYNENNFLTGTFRIRHPFLYSFDGPTKFYKEFNSGNKLIFYEDGPFNTVAVMEKQYEDIKARAIMNNGKSDSSTYGDTDTLKMLSHLPALFSKSRKNIMVIGMGTGVTAGELTLYPDTECIDIVEISPTVVKALPYFKAFNHDVMNDKRVHIHIGDAFRVLGRSNKQWNIVISEPSNPWVTGVDLLFSIEFFQLIKQHLTDDGIFIQWAHLYSSDNTMLEMILNTIQQEFKYSHAFTSNNSDLLIMASNKIFNRQDLIQSEQLFNNNKDVKTSLEKIRIRTFDALLIRELFSFSYIKENFSRSGIQTIDNPRLHYLAGKNFFTGVSINYNDIFNAKSASYYKDYLLAKKYTNWEQLTFSGEMFDSLNYAMQIAFSGRYLIMSGAVKQKAWFRDPVQFPLSEKEEQHYKLNIIPFITHYIDDEESWSKINCKNESFRKKISVLFTHMNHSRNWIFPYPIDGLKKIINQGIHYGESPHEQNWCSLMMALLMINERENIEKITNILDEMHKTPEGNIDISEKDENLLEKIKNICEHKKELFKQGIKSVD
jgi:predicted membrane-bound spermidine synthase